MSQRLYWNLGACGGILSSWLFVIIRLVGSVLVSGFGRDAGSLGCFCPQTDDNEDIKEL